MIAVRLFSLLFALIVIRILPFMNDTICPRLGQMFGAMYVSVLVTVNGIRTTHSMSFWSLPV